MSAENKPAAPDLRPETGEQAANPHETVDHTQLAGLHETGELLAKVLPAGEPLMLGQRPQCDLCGLFLDYPKIASCLISRDGDCPSVEVKP